MLNLPMPEEARWRDDIAQALALDGRERLVLKLILSRGTGGRGYAPPSPAQPRRLVQTFDWPVFPGAQAIEGASVILCSTRLGLNPLLAGVKHLNRLEQVLAAAEVQTAGADEGLMQDITGHLVEGTRTNLFLIRGRQLLTPSLEHAGIRGVTRDILLELAPSVGLEPREVAVTLEMLLSADEACLANSVIGLWPLKALLGEKTREWTSGVAVARLQARLQEHDATA